MTVELVLAIQTILYKGVSTSRGVGKLSSIDDLSGVDPQNRDARSNNGFDHVPSVELLAVIHGGSLACIRFQDSVSF